MTIPQVTQLVSSPANMASGVAKPDSKGHKGESVFARLLSEASPKSGGDSPLSANEHLGESLSKVREQAFDGDLLELEEPILKEGSATDSMPHELEGDVEQEIVAGLGVIPVEQRISKNGLDTIPAEARAADGLQKKNSSLGRDTQLVLDSTAQNEKSLSSDGRNAAARVEVPSSALQSGSQSARMATDMLAPAAAASATLSPGASSSSRLMPAALVERPSRPINGLAGLAGSQNASTAQAGKSIDPDDFMRHLSQSVQISQNLINWTDGRQPSVTNTPTELGDLGARVDMPATSQPLMGVGSPVSSIAANGLPVYTVSTNIEHEGWARAMSQQVISFMRRGDGEQVAQLRLDPPELGPIRVSITLAEGVAHTAFNAASAHVRQILEQSLPELSKAMSEAGINLGQTDIGDDQVRDERSNGSDRNGVVSKQRDGDRDDSAAERQAPIVARSHDGVVNTFA